MDGNKEIQAIFPITLQNEEGGQVRTHLILVVQRGGTQQLCHCFIHLPDLHQVVGPGIVHPQHQPLPQDRWIFAGVRSVAEFRPQDQLPVVLGAWFKSVPYAEGTGKGFGLIHRVMPEQQVIASLTGIIITVMQGKRTFQGCKGIAAPARFRHLGPFPAKAATVPSPTIIFKVKTVLSFQFERKK
jgi:hypothetical protein